ncbi:MAG: dihydropteroate synthase [Acidimicrobiia bacterium]|nr:dihydropteroate synthase [Acidimicrobiia bacterium]
MGVLNVTPDSFSDGGRYPSLDAAIAHGVRLRSEGADIVDVGGESTRPGADPVPVGDELARVIPVVGALASEGIAVSIDTAKPEVAEAAVAAGAIVVNDVTGLRNPAMLAAVAASESGVVIMHMQGEPRTMQDDPQYGDVVIDVRDFLVERARAAEAAGVAADRIAIDPGIGFGKTFDHNLALLRNLQVLVETGYPVLLGASRKAFLGQILGGKVPAAERDPATGATVALAIEQRVAVVRVHNVAMTMQIARTVEAILERSE